MNNLLFCKMYLYKQQNYITFTMYIRLAMDSILNNGNYSRLQSTCEASSHLSNSSVDERWVMVPDHSKAAPQFVGAGSSPIAEFGILHFLESRWRVMRGGNNKSWNWYCNRKYSCSNRALWSSATPHQWWFKSYMLHMSVQTQGLQ